MSKEPQDTETWVEFDSGENRPDAFFRRMTAVFNTDNVYGAIGVGIKATAQQVKTRIKRMLLVLHPDKNKLQGTNSKVLRRKRQQRNYS